MASTTLRVLAQALGCMYEDFGYLISGTTALVALVALSGIYPAYRLFVQKTRQARVLLWTVIGLALVVPLVFPVSWELRLASMDHPNARALQITPVSFDVLPFLYLLSATLAALLLWALFVWHKRAAA